MKTMIRDIFDLFNSYGAKAKEPVANELSRYFTSDIQMHSNGMTTSRSIHHLVTNLKKVQAMCSYFSFSDLLDDPLIDDDKMVFRYHVHFAEVFGRQGKMEVIVIATLEDKKISHWSQVMHEEAFFL